MRISRWLAVPALAATLAIGACTAEVEEEGELPDVDVRGAYWFVTTKGGFAMQPEPPMRPAQARAALERAMATVASGVSRKISRRSRHAMTRDVSMLS